MSPNHENKLIKELRDILGKLAFYKGLSDHFLKKEPPIGDPVDEIRAKANLRVFLLAKIGKYRDLITKLTGTDKTTIYEFGKPRTVDMWTMGLREDYDYRSTEALNDATVNLTMAISKLEREIDEGYRDEQGNLIAKGQISETLMATDTDQVPVHLFDAMQFHPKVVEASRSCFTTVNYREAILNAFISLIDYIKEITGLDLDGDNLMNNVFSFNYDKEQRKITKYPIIRINELKNKTDRDEQNGFMFLCKGAAAFIRNPKAHKLIAQTDPLHTLEYLAFASLLFRQLDKRR